MLLPYALYSKKLMAVSARFPIVNKLLDLNPLSASDCPYHLVSTVVYFLSYSM